MTLRTEVELYWHEGRIERWIRFGREVEERIVDRRRRVVAFAPGAVFAFVRWASNDFGTLVSRIDIVRAVDQGRGSRHRARRDARRRRAPPRLWLAQGAARAAGDRRRRGGDRR